MKGLNGTFLKKTRKASLFAPLANNYLSWDMSHYNKRRKREHKLASMHLCYSFLPRITMRMKPGILGDHSTLGSGQTNL